MATNFLKYTKHAVAGSSKLKATKAGHVYNIKVAADADNGKIVSKGAYVEAEVYAEAAAPTGFTAVVQDIAGNGNALVEVTNAAGAILLLNTPIIYEEMTTMMQNESNFFNAADDIVRGYELYDGDVFELSVEGFTTKADMAKGTALKADTTGKLVKNA